MQVAFLFRLETTDGAPAEPSTFQTAVPNWRVGDEVSLGRDEILRVIGHTTTCFRYRELR
jgi:hypothetical protein